MSTGRMIDYRALAQDAMRGVVRAVLARTAKSGLPGDHHFFISFDTQASGVSVSKRLKEKYPEEMTIVLQHRFWDLAVTEDRFEVKLTFDGIPERLVVPFAAVKVFFDPSVHYGLQFGAPGFRSDAMAHPQGGDESAMSPASGELPVALRSPRAASERKPRPARTKARSDRLGEAQGQGAAAGAGRPAVPSSAPAPAEGGEQPPGGARVVSLDAFRKK